ncbi:MAG: TIGR03086 family metal-binding protein [Microthrixaceae bacterium]|jgi:uncharacterized protein (TIGR03086 family)
MQTPTYTDARAALDLAIAGFEARLALVADPDWERPTPCDGWTVADLVKHLVGGGLMSEMLLDGASSQDAMATLFNLDLQGDLRAAFVDARDRQAVAFARPGAEDITCHHPMRDMPASQFIWMRVRDTAVHTWDLARSIGADERLDDDLMATIWSQVEPVAPLLAVSGMFGSGASGELTDDASMQARVLDALGRRPSV